MRNNAHSHSTENVKFGQWKRWTQTEHIFHVTKPLIFHCPWSFHTHKNWRAWEHKTRDLEDSGFDSMFVLLQSSCSPSWMHLVQAPWPLGRSGDPRVCFPLRSLSRGHEWWELHCDPASGSIRTCYDCVEVRRGVGAMKGRKGSFSWISRHFR